jgi:hypothetical protein
MLGGTPTRLRGPCDSRCGLWFEAEGKLFDYRIDQHFASDALDLCLRLRWIGGERIFECELKIFPLAHIGDSVRSHAPERSGYGLTLGVQHRPLQRDINMRFHQVRL